MRSTPVLPNNPEKMKRALIDPRPETFDELVAGHQNRILFFIRSMVYQPEDARDVLQDVNIILFRKRAQFVMGTNFTAWSFAIARFECLSYLARRKNMPWDAMDHGLIEKIADRAEERADDMEKWLHALEECRRRLPEESSRLLALRYEEKARLEMIAAGWSTSVGSLKQKLLRIRAQLRECILKRLPPEISSGDNFQA